MQPDGGYAPLTPEEQAAAQAARDEAAADAAQAAALQTTPPPASSASTELAPAGTPPPPTETYRYPTATGSTQPGTGEASYEAVDPQYGQAISPAPAYTEQAPSAQAPPPPSSEPPSIGSLLDPHYVPRDQGPGMYSPPFHRPGIYTELPPYRAPKPEFPVTEPGMYTGRWERPGEAMVTPPANEPGMYEPHYVQPGYYTPRSASTYYGGDVWPTPYTGTERSATIPGQMEAGPMRNAVQVLDPATSTGTVRIVPDLGTAQLIQPGPARHTPETIDPVSQSRNELLGRMAGGGQAPPVPVPTLGMMASQIAYLDRQGDPRVTRTADGRLVLVDDLPWHPPMEDRLKGLYGGGEQHTPRPTPSPATKRRR